MATSLTDLVSPQIVTAPGSAGITDAQRQNDLLQHLMASLDKRQREALWGKIPGAPGSEQGAAVSDLVNANRPEAQQTLALLNALRAGEGHGIIKEPGVLGQLLNMADQAAKERQAATVEQLRLARLPLADLRKYVDDATPQQLAELMTGYQNLRGDVKNVLESNLEKISQTAGKASTLARDLLNEDVESMAKAIGSSATEIQSHVDKANAAMRGGVQEAQQMGAEAGKGAVTDIRAAVEEARKGVLPSAQAREQALGTGYESLAQQQAGTLAASKAEGMGLASQLGAGRKAEINERFDEMATREGERLEQSLRSRGLENTTIADSQRQGLLAKVERGRSDALRQLNDQIAQQQLGQFNEWEKLRAMAGERIGLPGLGARERTGAAADRIAAQLESAGLGAGAQAALGTQRGEQDLGRLLAGKAGDFQMAGLQGLLQQEGAKTQAIAGGWRQKMALSAQLAQLGFTEQANALRQQADAEREIGGRSLTALQQGQQDMGRQLANVTQAQSGLEERVEHQGMNPALWLDLAKGLGVASQQGPALGGMLAPALMGMMPWGQFPGGDKEGEKKPDPKELRDIINRINIQIGDGMQLGGGPDVTGPDGKKYVSYVDDQGNQQYRPEDDIVPGYDTLDREKNPPASVPPNYQIVVEGGKTFYVDPATKVKYIWNPDTKSLTSAPITLSDKADADADAEADWSYDPIEKQWYNPSGEKVSERNVPNEVKDNVDSYTRKADAGHMNIEEDRLGPSKKTPTTTPATTPAPDVKIPVWTELNASTIVPAATRPSDVLAQINAGNPEAAQNLLGQLNEQVSNRQNAATPATSSGTGRILTSANAPGAQYDPVRKQWWKPKPAAAPATSLTSILEKLREQQVTQPQVTQPQVTQPQVTQPQVTQQDLLNYQNDLRHRRPNVSNSGYQELLNQFRQQQQQNVPNTVSAIASTPAPNQAGVTPVTAAERATPAPVATYNNTPVNEHWVRDTQGKTDAQKAQLWNFGGSFYKA